MNNLKCAVVLGVALVASACSPSTPKPEPQSPGDISLLAADDSDAATKAQVADAFKKGEAAIESERFADAQAIFSDLLKSHPKNARAQYYVGVCLEHAGDRDAAAQSYRAALQLMPSLKPASLNLSALLLDLSKYAEASEVLKAALAVDPSEPTLHINQAQALTGLGDKQGAVKEYRTVLVKNDDPVVRLELATLLVDLGQTAEASDELKKVVETAGHQRALLASASREFGRLHSYANCVSALDQAIAIKPAAELYVERGVCRHGLGDNPGAKGDYEQATKLDPSYAPAYYYLGMHWVSVKNTAQAVAALQQCVKLAGDNPIGKRASEKLAQLGPAGATPKKPKN